MSEIPAKLDLSAVWPPRSTDSSSLSSGVSLLSCVGRMCTGRINSDGGAIDSSNSSADASAPIPLRPVKGQVWISPLPQSSTAQHSDAHNASLDAECGQSLVISSPEFESKHEAAMSTTQAFHDVGSTPDAHNNTHNQTHSSDIKTTQSLLSDEPDLTSNDTTAASSTFTSTRTFTLPPFSYMRFLSHMSRPRCARAVRRIKSLTRRLASRPVPVLQGSSYTLDTPFTQLTQLQRDREREIAQVMLDEYAYIHGKCSKIVSKLFRKGGPFFAARHTPELTSTPNKTEHCRSTSANDSLDDPLNDLAKRIADGHDNIDELFILEGIGRFVFSKLHARYFAMNPDFVRTDRALTRRLREWRWVSFRHLDVHPAGRLGVQSIDRAANQLCLLPTRTSPMDKLACVVNAVSILFEGLRCAAQTYHCNARKHQTAATESKISVDSSTASDNTRCSAVSDVWKGRKCADNVAVRIKIDVSVDANCVVRFVDIESENELKRTPMSSPDAQCTKTQSTSRKPHSASPAMDEFFPLFLLTIIRAAARDRSECGTSLCHSCQMHPLPSSYAKSVDENQCTTHIDESSSSGNDQDGEDVCISDSDNDRKHNFLDGVYGSTEGVDTSGFLSLQHSLSHNNEGNTTHIRGDVKDGDGGGSEELADIDGSVCHSQLLHSASVNEPCVDTNACDLNAPSNVNGTYEEPDDGVTSPYRENVRPSLSENVSPHTVNSDSNEDIHIHSTQGLLGSGGSGPSWADEEDSSGNEVSPVSPLTVCEPAFDHDIIGTELQNSVKMGAKSNDIPRTDAIGHVQARNCMRVDGKSDSVGGQKNGMQDESGKHQCTCTDSTETPHPDRVQNIYLHMEFTSLCRHPRLWTSEARYVMTVWASALTFFLQGNERSLSMMNGESYEELCARFQ